MASSKTMHPALYRASQFFAALKANLPVWAGGVGGELAPEDERFVKSILSTPPQQQLFQQMSPNDRRHAIAVARRLQQADYRQPALLQAALLHDVGKSIGQPIIHRVLIVLFEAFWPATLNWLSGQPVPPATHHSLSWWRRPFVVHAQHPATGALWAKEARCAPLVITLILKHQDKLNGDFSSSIEQELLAALQWADNLN
jgi:hypothetical protein